MMHLREQLQEDSICSEVMSFCEKEWSNYSKLTGPSEAYWPERAVLTMHDGRLLKGASLVIPTVMCNSLFQALHKGRQGVTRCLYQAWMRLFGGQS